MCHSGVFSCLPVSQSAFQQELNSAMTAASQKASRHFSSSPDVIVWKRERQNTSMPFPCNQTLVCWKQAGEKEKWSCVHEVLDSTLGYLKSYDLHMDPTPPKVNPPTQWHMVTFHRDNSVSYDVQQDVLFQAVTRCRAKHWHYSEADCVMIGTIKVVLTNCGIWEC